MDRKRLEELQKKLETMDKQMPMEKFIKFVEEEQEKNWKEDHPEGAASMKYVVVENGFTKVELREDRYLLISENGEDLFLIEKNRLKKYIGDSEDVVIPEGVTGFRSSAFLDACTKVRSITIPKSMTTVGMGACALLDDLESVTLHENVSRIGAKAFLSCTRLKTINIPKHTEISTVETFLNCPALADKDGFIVVNGILFGYMGSETSVTVPEGVTAIAAKAFISPKCRVRSVTLPNSVTHIHTNAFAGCSKLETVTVPDSVAFIGELAFHGLPKLCRIEVPISAIIEEGAFDATVEVIRRARDD